MDPHSKFPYEANNKAKFIQKSVIDIAGEELSSLYSEGAIKLLAGCAPCQPFSTYSQGPRGKNDGQWRLLKEFERLIGEVQPELVTMENVPALKSHPVFEEFVKNLKAQNYSVSYKIIACDQYGLAQTRKRLVLVGSRLGEISLLPPTGALRTVRDVLAHLPVQKAGQANTSDPFHCSAALSEINQRRIKASKPGGSWKDWPKSLVATCHKRASGRTYPSVYGRMEWDKPAPTMTTQYYGFGNGRFGHPDQDRAITLREGALLQGFPSSYRFVKEGEKIHFSRVGKLVGNAVPPPLGNLIGRSFYSHLSQVNSTTGL